jgi:hypothetical protein
VSAIEKAVFVTSTRQVASRRKAARGGEFGTGGLGSGRRRPQRYLVGACDSEHPRPGVASSTNQYRWKVRPSRSTEHRSFAIAELPERPHRPARYADLTAMIDAYGGSAQVVPGELAASTARTVLDAARSGDGDVAALVELGDSVGLETLRSLWRGAEAVSLAGSLWTLYLLRHWCHTDPRRVSEIWRAGIALAAADAVVAGVGMHGDEDAIGEFADVVLTGAFRGDFAVALERAAAFFRVAAAGRRRLGTEDENLAEQQDGSAERNEQAAIALTAAARRYRAGTLV